MGLCMALVHELIDNPFFDQILFQGEVEKFLAGFASEIGCEIIFGHSSQRLTLQLFDQ